MIGFRITMSDGSTRSIGADRYTVDDSGELIVNGGDTELLRCRAGEWVVVNALGTRLAERWPPDDLDLVVASVAEELGVRFGHYVHELRELDRFEDWRMNDLDALTAEFLAAVRADAADSSHRAEVAAVRRLVAGHFHIARDQ